jgi:hypothetical protein
MSDLEVGCPQPCGKAPNLTIQAFSNSD